MYNYRVTYKGFQDQINTKTEEASYYFIKENAAIFHNEYDEVVVTYSLHNLVAIRRLPAVEEDY